MDNVPPEQAFNKDEYYARRAAKRRLTDAFRTDGRVIPNHFQRDPTKKYKLTAKAKARREYNALSYAEWLAKQDENAQDWLTGTPEGKKYKSWMRRATAESSLTGPQMYMKLLLAHRRSQDNTKRHKKRLQTFLDSLSENQRSLYFHDMHTSPKAQLQLGFPPTDKWSRKYNGYIEAAYNPPEPVNKEWFNQGAAMNLVPNFFLRAGMPEDVDWKEVGQREVFQPRYHVNAMDYVNSARTNRKDNHALFNPNYGEEYNQDQGDDMSLGTTIGNSFESV